jgi:hypothetical protein
MAEWAQQHHVLPSMYKGLMQSLLQQRNKQHIWVGSIFVHLMGEDSNTIASIQHLFKTVPIQVAQHLKAHCTIMWMKAGTDLS